MLSTLHFCKFAGEGHKEQLTMTRITALHVLALLSDSLVRASLVTGGWRAGGSLDLALEGGVHGGAGQAVAQGGPVHAPHTGQVVGGVGAHTSGQGGS